MSEEEKIETLKDKFLKYHLEYKDEEMLFEIIEELQKEIKNADERNSSLGIAFIQIGEKLGLESFGKQAILLEIDKLQKENKKYIDVFNSTEKIMNGQERTKDKLLKENVELQKENEDMRKELKVTRQMNCNLIEVLNECITKDIIRNKIKEMQTEKINGFHKTYIAEEVLNELLGE